MNPQAEVGFRAGGFFFDARSARRQKLLQLFLALPAARVALGALGPPAARPPPPAARPRPGRVTSAVCVLVQPPRLELSTYIRSLSKPWSATDSGRKSDVRNTGCDPNPQILLRLSEVPACADILLLSETLQKLKEV
ncbi:hypothetical protein EVAR_92977_1 [Eumeta japonica]|uniref:Uncharacterized protein n=1 Tax=Eumeta variegata TaxID=151549 RepID=A0A4C1TD31_EUMVA|nr:hypothetical protein EVAR_92977_1 [Eumeta japonica]